MSDEHKYFTAIYRDVTPGDEAREIGQHPKWIAGGWSHMARERDASLASKDAEIADLRASSEAATAAFNGALRNTADVQEMLHEANAEIARLREDAERYRWLRRSLYWDGHAWWIPDLPVSSPDVHSLSQSDDVPYPTDAEIDASVDAEIEHDRSARKKG